jgi:hypothetical protein
MRPRRAHSPPPETIKNNGEEIINRVRISSDKLRRQVETLSDKLADLKAMTATA